MLVVRIVCYFLGTTLRVNLRALREHRESIDDELVWKRRGRQFDSLGWSLNFGMTCVLALRVCPTARTGSSYQPSSENSASRAMCRFLVLIQSSFLERVYVYYPTMAFSVGLMVLLTAETSPTPDAIALSDGVSNTKSGEFITHHDHTYQLSLLWLIFGLQIDNLLESRLDGV